MDLVSEPERRHFLGRVIREVSRAELMVPEHALREERRIGREAPPASALRAVAAHASEMRPRFASLVAGYGLPPPRGGLGAALATLRDRVVDRIVQDERAYRIAVLDLRNGLDLVKMLREATRGDQLLGLIRWCDDWLGARRPLISQAERALAWFSASPALTDVGPPEGPRPQDPVAPTTSDDRPSSHDHR